MERLNVPITFEFEPFPLWQSGRRPTSLRSGYWFQVEPSRRPTVVDPRDLARTITLGKQVMAFIEGEEIYYITSSNDEYPYPGVIGCQGTGLIPICFREEQEWAKSIPWDRLAQMTVRKMGSFIVFTDWTLDCEKVTTRFYQVVPSLNAFALTTAARL